MKSDFDQRMDALAMRMSDVASGESILDVATVCARMIAFAIAEAYETDEHRMMAMEKLIAFMRKDLAGMMKPEGPVQ